MPAYGAPPVPAQRPTGVTVLAVLAFIGAAFAILAGFVLLAAGAFLGAMGAGTGADGLGFIAALGAAAALFVFLYAGVAIAVGIGLLKRKRWAWYVALVLGALQVLGGFGSLVAMDIFSALLNLAIGGLVIWYLLSPPVQAWFAVSHNTPWKYKTTA